LCPPDPENWKFEFFGPEGHFFEEAAGDSEGAERGAVHLCSAAAKERRIRRGESACGRKRSLEDRILQEVCLCLRNETEGTRCGRA
jgi:hypothetical protein